MRVSDTILLRPSAFVSVDKTQSRLLDEMLIYYAAIYGQYTTSTTRPPHVGVS